MKGFYVAAAGSVLGSALVFVVLRLLFSRRLRKWSSSNEKWQALESVVVSFNSVLVMNMSDNISFDLQQAKGLPLIMLIRASPFPPWVYANSLFAVSPMLSRALHVLKQCVIVYRGRRTVAIRDCNNSGLSQNSAACIHWFATCSPVRRRHASADGYA